MSIPVISRDVFEKRLIAICLRSTHAGLPRKLSDKHILLRAIAMSLPEHQCYREVELNAALNAWVASLDSELDIDHATLRRALVDYGYVARDRSGATYQMRSAGRADVEFAPEVAEVSVIEVISAAQADIARRREIARQRASAPA